MSGFGGVHEHPSGTDRPVPGLLDGQSGLGGLNRPESVEAASNGATSDRPADPGGTSGPGPADAVGQDGEAAAHRAADMEAAGAMVLQVGLPGRAELWHEDAGAGKAEHREGAATGALPAPQIDGQAFATAAGIGTAATDAAASASAAGAGTGPDPEHRQAEAADGEAPVSRHDAPEPASPHPAAHDEGASGMEPADSGPEHIAATTIAAATPVHAGSGVGNHQAVRAANPDAATTFVAPPTSQVAGDMRMPAADEDDGTALAVAVSHAPHVAPVVAGPAQGEDAAAATSVSRQAQDAADAERTPAVGTEHDRNTLATTLESAPARVLGVADSTSTAATPHFGGEVITVGVPAPSQDAADANGTVPAGSEYDRDEVTTIVVSTPAQDAAAAAGTLAAGANDDAGEVTTIVVSFPAQDAADAAGTSAVGTDYDQDEVTTVLVAAPAYDADAGGNPAASTAYDTDEVTTIVVSALAPGSVAAGSLPPANTDYDGDEVTTVVVADPGRGEDEITTLVLTASASALQEPAGNPDASLGYDEEVTTVVVAAAGEEDEVTTVLVAAAEYADDVPDERTTVVQADPPPHHGTPAQAGAYPAESRLPETGSAGTAGAEADGAASRPAMHAEEPSVTEVIQMLHPQGAGVSDQDRHWFEAVLAQFVAALRQDEAGRPRSQDERHALAAAARDAITRLTMQSVRTGEGWATDTVLQPDQLLANTYTVRGLIARGGIGEIYRVRHRDLKTEHAIKILLPHHALDSTMQALMLEEARLLRRVQHEAVVRAQDLLRDADGRPMLVMDYVRGRTLASRLREGHLSADDILALTRRLAEGLSAIHATGIVHQDISPDNIILAEDSCAAATIIDFGLARVVGGGRDTHRNLDFAGKYSWSSPEQLSGRPASVDARSDLYSLGLILAAAYRGYRLEMGNDLESARAARRTVPSLSGVEEPVRGLLAKLLAPAPEARLASAAEIHGMLETRRVSWWRGWLGM